MLQCLNARLKNNPAEYGNQDEHIDQNQMRRRKTFNLTLANYKMLTQFSTYTAYLNGFKFIFLHSYRLLNGIFGDAISCFITIGNENCLTKNPGIEKFIQ